MERFEPTPEQQAVIAHRGSHMLVFAGPGTGKTETLARRFASLVHDDGLAPGTILVLTFSRRAADAMRRRIVQRLRERSGKGIAVPELHVYTFHSFCRRLLEADRPRGARRDLLTPVKERLLWKRVVAAVTLRTFSADVLESTTFANAVLNLIARLKGEGVTPDDFARDARGDDRLADLAELYRLMHEQRSGLGLSDFRDLVADAVRELREPNSAAVKWLRNRDPFEHVLVDEFQDSDPMQLRLLEALGGGALFSKSPQPQMCFVGDFNQSIYRFRGAEPNNIATAKERFACVEFGLRLNRRSAQSILEVANRTPRLRPESLTIADPSRAALGSVRLVRTETADEEIAAIADAVAEKVRSGTPPREIAVLLRIVEPYRGAIARELEARGIAVAAQSATGFHEDSLIDAVLSSVRIIAGQQDVGIWKRLLTNPLVGFRPLSVSFAFDRGRSKSSARRALDAHPPSGRHLWTDFIERFDTCRKAGGPAYRFDPAALVEAIARELDLLWPIREPHGIPGFHPSASPARLGALIAAAHDIRETIPKVGGPRLTPASFLAALEELTALLADPYEEPLPGMDGVPVMSIHAAKGLEFDFVVIPQLIDGALPTHARSDPLLGARRLSYSQRVEDAALEEASLWYVAVTRARLDVLATAARLGDDAAEQTLSPFAHLVRSTGDGEAGGFTSTQPSRLEPAGFAAAYAAASPEQRSSASTERYLSERPVLAAYLGQGRLVEERPRNLTWAIDRLSPSGIERYVECPRRWFYQFALQLPEDNEDVTRLGRFVHTVLERYHSVARDFSRERARRLSPDRILTELEPILQEEAVRTAAESGLSKESSIFRYEYARILRQLAGYATWLIDEARNEPFTVLDVERRVDIALDDIRLVGKVDRVDALEDGRLVIRDYKTGKFRTKPSADVLAATLNALDPSVPGIGLFGNMPEGLRLQSLLYVRGVEAAFAGTVQRADYLYLAGTKQEPDVTTVDSIDIADLTRPDMDRVYDVIGAAVAREILGGRLSAFPTARDEQTCRFCGFKAICPGPGTIAYETAARSASERSTLFDHEARSAASERSPSGDRQLSLDLRNGPAA